MVTGKWQSIGKDLSLTENWENTLDFDLLVIIQRQGLK